MTTTLNPTLSESHATLPKELFGYEVLDYLGQGARSDIYVVSDPQTHQIYALKHVVRKSEKDDRFIEQLENEYEIGRQVRHEGMRRCLDLKVNRTLLRKTIDAAMVMELFDGTPLDTKPTTNLIDTMDCFIQTAKAIESLHQLGYVHCDLKPNNILRAPTGAVKVIDLGQTARVGTVKKRIQGTPDYISPEQVKLQPISTRTDVYNFGATLYWALTGRNLPTLFTLEKSENSFLVDEKMASPRDLNQNVPEQLSDLVMQCVRLSPSKRPEFSEIIRRMEVIEYAIKRNQRNAFHPSSRMARAS
jgi:eukaryotic-like serine/threonine-protein kinase